MNNIKDWPQNERPHEKLLEKGAEALSHAELLAIFLQNGIAGKNAVDLGRQLLTDFGSLHELLHAEKSRLCSVKGIGKIRYARFQAALELGRRYTAGKLRTRALLGNPQQTCNYAASCLTGRKQEIFLCMFIDVRNRLIVSEELFYGTVDGTAVYPREVARRCLMHNAAAVIFAHNHPSGDATPSIADRRITKRLVKALALLDIRVLDHVIVGAGQTTSFSDKGLL